MARKNLHSNEFINEKISKYRCAPINLKPEVSNLLSLYLKIIK